MKVFKKKIFKKVVQAGIEIFFFPLDHLMGRVVTFMNGNIFLYVTVLCS